MPVSVDVAVVGSINADVTYILGHLPLPGETALSTSRHDAPGGKGANQAVALAALGVSVDMVGAVGNDGQGHALVDSLRQRGVGCEAITTTEELPTGSAVILVASNGENSIVVDAGANGAVSPEQVEAYLAERSPRIVMAQLEIPLATVLCAAHASSGTFILNPAPMPEYSDELRELINACDILVPNRTELAALAGTAVPESLEDVIATARKLPFDGQLVVTLGSDGAVIFPEGIAGEPVSIKAPQVTARDASGAGDAFCAALAAGLLRGKDLVGAIDYACEFASWTTTQIGAQVGEVAPEHRLVSA